MIIIFLIIAVISIGLLIAYWRKKPIFRHIPWLWNNIGRPLRDYLLVTSVRKITLAYFTLISGLSISIPWRKISACVSDGKSIGWLSFELDDGDIDIYTCIAVLAVTIAYVYFIKYETAKLDNNKQSWIDRLFEKIDDSQKLLSLIAQNKKECEVSFADGSNEIVIQPRFKRITYVHQSLSTVGKTSMSSTKKDLTTSVIQGGLSGKYMQALIDKQQCVQYARFYVCIGKHLLSYAPIDIILHSTGRDPLDDVYLQIEADNEDVRITDTNRELNGLNVNLMELQCRLQNRQVTNNKVRSHVATINGGLEFKIKTFYVKPPHDCKDFNLIWKVNARSFQRMGALHVKVSPEYIYERRTTQEDAMRTVVEDYEEDIKQE